MQNKDTDSPNYHKVALSVFKSSEKSYQYDLNPYDLSFLETIATYQDFKLHVCKASNSEIAKRSRISERQVIRIQNKLESIGLIKVKKVWKMNHIILSDLIATQPKEWSLVGRKVIHRQSLSSDCQSPEKPLKCLPVTRSSDCQSPDQVTVSHLTIENKEKENKEKEMCRATLFNFIPDKSQKALCNVLGLDLSSQLDRFKSRHSGKGDINLEFRNWLISSKNYKDGNIRNKKSNDKLEEVTVQFWGPGHPSWEAINGRK